MFRRMPLRCRSGGRLDRAAADEDVLGPDRDGLGRAVGAADRRTGRRRPGRHAAGCAVTRQSAARWAPASMARGISVRAIVCFVPRPCVVVREHPGELDRCASRARSAPRSSTADDGGGAPGSRADGDLVLDLGPRTGRGRPRAELGDPRSRAATRRRARAGSRWYRPLLISVLPPTQRPSAYAMPGRAERGGRALVAVLRDDLLERERLDARRGRPTGPPRRPCTDRPARRACAAVTAPPAPEPMTRTSVSTCRCTVDVLSSCSRRRSRATTSRRGVLADRRRCGCCSHPADRAPDRGRSGSAPSRSRTHAPSTSDSTATPSRRCSGIAASDVAHEGRDRTAGAHVVVAREGVHDTPLQPEHRARRSPSPGGPDAETVGSPQPDDAIDDHRGRGGDEDRGLGARSGTAGCRT